MKKANCIAYPVEQTTGYGLAFKNGVIYEATELTPKEEILSFQQIKGMIALEQWKAIAEEFLCNHPEMKLKVNDDNFMQILENHYYTAEIRGSIIYMMTYSDGDFAVRCVGYSKFC